MIIVNLFLKVTVFALLEEPPAIYMSHAHFTSDAKGEVHLSDMVPTDGTYKGKSLFVSFLLFYMIDDHL